jgi:hypothetical protein
MRSDIVQLPANVGVIRRERAGRPPRSRMSSGGSAGWAGDSACPVAGLQFAFPTFTEGATMAAKMLVGELGVGAMPQLWSTLSGPQ